MSYFPRDLQLSSVAWETGQMVSPAHFYELENHLRSFALLPPGSLAMGNGLLRIPLGQLSAQFSFQCDVVSATRRMVHVTLDRCTGLTPEHRWVFLTENIEASFPIDSIEGRFPEIYLSVQATGEEHYSVTQDSPVAAGDAQLLGQQRQRRVRRPGFRIVASLHEPHTQAELPMMPPHSLLFGQLLERGGAYEQNIEFLMPVVFVRDSVAWQRKVAEVRQEAWKCCEQLQQYFRDDMEFDPLQNKSHVLSQMIQLIEPLVGLGRNPDIPSKDLLERYFSVFRSFQAFFVVHQHYLRSLGAGEEVRALYEQILLTRQLFERYDLSHQILNAFPLLDAAQRAIRCMGALAALTRQALEQDTSTPPSQQFQWRIDNIPMILQYEGQMRKFHYDRNMRRLLLQIPHNELPEVPFIKAVAVLFKFAKSQDKDAYNTGEPQVQWRVTDQENFRTNNIFIMREGPLREAANSVGYVGVFMDFREIEHHTVGTFSLWLPGDNVPTEARCYFYTERPVVTTEKPKVSPPVITPLEDEVW